MYLGFSGDQGGEHVSVPRCKIYCLGGDRMACQQALRLTLDSKSKEYVDFEDIVWLQVVLGRRLSHLIDKVVEPFKVFHCHSDLSCSKSCKIFRSNSSVL